MKKTSNHVIQRGKDFVLLDTSSPKVGGRTIVIDSEDFERVKGKKIFAHETSPGEITEKIRIKTEDGESRETTLARFIMNAGPGERVRKAGSDNDYRKGKLNVSAKPSEYFGVIRDKFGKFGFRLYNQGTTIRGGPFTTAEDAARAFDFKKIELKGKRARKLNFEDSPEQYEDRRKNGDKRNVHMLDESVKPHQLVTIDKAKAFLGITEEEILSFVTAGDVRLSYDDLKHERWPNRYA